MSRHSLRPRIDGPCGPTSRRSVLAALGAVGTAAATGCVQRVRSLGDRDGPKQLSLTIKTLPTDADPWGIQVSQFLARRLRSVGIRAKVVPMRRISLLRDVLMDQDFDLYVARAPSTVEPDVLRPLLHSRFRAERGWQNPFGYADSDVDQQLVDQRRQYGATRRKTLESIQRTIARTQPFVPVGVPDEIRAVRTDRFHGWDAHDIHTVRGYLALRSREDRGDQIEDGRRTLRMTIIDSRPTKNLNPLSVAYRGTGVITGLLYDPLGRRLDGAIEPWLAASWTWSEPSDSGAMTAEVTLREDLRWHDGTPLSAEDVAFTYRLLHDTSLDGLERQVPAPRFRGQSSLVASVDVTDSQTVRFRFEPSSRHVARRAFTVPILPSHVWERKTGAATIANLDSNAPVTEALVWNNLDPVGSGPLAFERAARRDSLTLTRFDGHFLDRDTLDEHLEPYRGGLDADRLTFTVAPSGDTAVQLVEEGSADATADGVTPSAVPRIGRSNAVELTVTPSRSLYHVGFNVRRSPYSDPRFRRATARLLDKPYLIENVFDGYATPAASPLAGHPLLAPSLRWDGTDPVLPFAGTNGTLDTEAAKTEFREAGYRYSDRGELIVP